MSDSFQCIVGGRIQGAYVLIGETAAREPLKENFETIYLLPLCQAHNIYSAVSGDKGDGYYMKLAREMRAVILTGYMNKPILPEEL